MSKISEICVYDYNTCFILECRKPKIKKFVYAASASCYGITEKSVKEKFMGVQIQLNSQGFRNNIDIDNSKKKILMLGDSMTLGWGSNETFSSSLEKRLNKNFQVLNAGIGNTNTYMQINNFFENYEKYDFDVIILNFFIISNGKTQTGLFRQKIINILNFEWFLDSL